MNIYDRRRVKKYKDILEKEVRVNVGIHFKNKEGKSYGNRVYNFFDSFYYIFNCFFKKFSKKGLKKSTT